MKSVEINKLWSMIKANQNRKFRTKTGRCFSYVATDRVVSLNNTNRNIPISDFEKALSLWPTDRVADLNFAQGYAYVWGILNVLLNKGNVSCEI